MLPLLIRRTSVPDTLPLSVADAKAHLRVDADGEDALIEGFIEAAASAWEEYCNRPLMSATYEAVYGCWPADKVLDGLPPETAGVTQVFYQPADLALDKVEVLPGDEWKELPSKRGALLLIDRPDLTRVAAMEPLLVRYTAGAMSADALPAHRKQALLLMVAHSYEVRQPVVYGNLSEADPELARLLALDRLIPL